MIFSNGDKDLLLGVPVLQFRTEKSGYLLFIKLLLNVILEINALVFDMILEDFRGGRVSIENFLEKKTYIILIPIFF